MMMTKFKAFKLYVNRLFRLNNNNKSNIELGFLKMSPAMNVTRNPLGVALYSARCWSRIIYLQIKRGRVENICCVLTW